MDDPGAMVLPLTGKVIVLIFPGWVACGSHAVFASQARAYRALGATVVTLAVNDEPALKGGARAERYLRLSADIVAEKREWTAMSPAGVLDPRFVRALYRRLRGDIATLRIEVARRTPLPRQVLDLPTIDLIHCNHFFCMPLATRLAKHMSKPIVLDTHDVQARQYRLANKAAWTLPPSVSFDDMLAVELDWTGKANLILHLNADEKDAFKTLLPNNHHALLYPTVAPVSWEAGGDKVLMIAAENQPNIESVEWLLREVVPLVPHLPFWIVGSVGGGLKRKFPPLFERYASFFTARVEDIQTAYRQAAVVILPTVSGNGISIKTIEALSSGAPIVATHHAFRGMTIDAHLAANITLAADAATFANALSEARHSQTTSSKASGQNSRVLYEHLFSAKAYQTKLEHLLRPLLARAATHDAHHFGR